MIFWLKPQNHTTSYVSVVWFLGSKQNISCVPGKTSPMFQEGHLLCSKQDISSVPSKTSPMFHAGHLLCSKQDISYAPSRTSLVFQAGHLLCFKQDISYVPSKTSPMFQAGHLLCSKEDISCGPITKNQHATFWWIRPIVPGLFLIEVGCGANPGTIGLIRPKVAFQLQMAKKSRG